MVRYPPEVRGDGIRYQGAVVRGGQLLLIRYRPSSGEPFWLFPGGGREDETPEECVARELHEETGLRVQVERLLLEVAADEEGIYRVWRTYLCSAEEGEARPGFEPGDEHMGSIIAVGWFDLSDQDSWNADLVSDSIAYPQLEKIRTLLGYG